MPWDDDNQSDGEGGRRGGAWHPAADSGDGGSKPKSCLVLFLMMTMPVLGLVAAAAGALNALL